MLLRNPINAELSVMRPSLLPNLVSAAARTEPGRKQDDGALFEVGPRFFGAQPGEQEVARPACASARPNQRHWAAAPRPVDAIDARADAQAVLAAAGVKPEACRSTPRGPAVPPGPPRPPVPGRRPCSPSSASCIPAILRRSGIAGRVVGFELFLDRLPKPKAGPRARGRR